MGDVEDAVHLGDRLREAEDQLGPIGLVGDGPGAFPDAQRLGERAGLRALAGEEHALGRHEHVVEHDDRFGDALTRG